MMRPLALTNLLRACVLEAIFFSCHSVHAQPSPPSRALSLIIDTGNRICFDIELHGQRRRYTARANAVDSGHQIANATGEEYQGVLPEDLISAAKSSLDCRLRVLDLLMDRILPAPGQSPKVTGETPTVPQQAKYEVIGDPAAFVSSVMNSMCYLKSGMVERSSKGKCTSKSCLINANVTASYSDKTIYITPDFEVMFSDPIPQLNRSVSDQASQEWPSNSGERRIRVNARIDLKTQSPDYASLLSDCVQRVGKTIFSRFELYESGSMLARLPASARSDFIVNEISLRDLDLAKIQIWLPKSLKSDAAYSVELRLIPSSVLRAEMPDINPAKILEGIRDDFEKFKTEINNSLLQNGASIDPRSWEIEFEISNYEVENLKAKGDELQSAAIRLNGNNITSTSLTLDWQALKAFKAGIWSWFVKPTSSGDQTLFFTIDAKRADGGVVSTVVPIQVLVEDDAAHVVIRFIQNNWQWIAGTIVIPVVVFMWSRFENSKTQPARPKQRTPFYKRQLSNRHRRRQ